MRTTRIASGLPRQLLLALGFAVLVSASPVRAQKLPICCEDFTGSVDGLPDRTVDVIDLLALLAQWGASPATHPSPDIAPFSADGCPAGGDGIVDVGDLLALLSSWGPCDSAVDDCPGVLDPANTYARISEDGVYPFRINGLLDGPQLGPTNDLCSCVPCLPAVHGWANYGPDAILGMYQFGDKFGIDMRTDPFTEGGDVWFHYTAPGNGSASFETVSGCGDGELTNTLIDIYTADACPPSEAGCCPASWFVRSDDDSAPETCSSSLSLIRLNVFEGESFLIRIGGWLAERGDGALKTTFFDNSNFEQALPIAVPGITGTTVGAAIPMAPACAGIEVVAPGRWYTFVGNGGMATVKTCLSSFNPACISDEERLFGVRLSIYTSTDDTAAGLTCVAAANDDTCDLGESITWTTQAGDRYYILVHGTPNVPDPYLAEGPYVLSLQLEP